MEPLGAPPPQESPLADGTCATSDSTAHSTGTTAKTECNDTGKLRKRKMDDTICPIEAAERFLESVKAKRVNPDAKRVVDMTVEQLMTDDGSGPVLYIPSVHKARILRLYGGHTMLDFDELYDFNSKIGGHLANCFQSMIQWMNHLEGQLLFQWEKVSDDRVLGDVFNIVQSAVRSRIGECVWYE